jgi:hypothetical protein
MPHLFCIDDRESQVLLLNSQIPVPPARLYGTGGREVQPLWKLPFIERVIDACSCIALLPNGEATLLLSPDPAVLLALLREGRTTIVTADQPFANIALGINGLKTLNLEDDPGLVADLLEMAHTVIALPDDALDSIRLLETGSAVLSIGTNARATLNVRANATATLDLETCDDEESCS